jgi:hypothetical protein
MKNKKRPLAAGQADQQGASINYTKDTPSPLVGQGEASQGNIWGVIHPPITGKRFRSEYNACLSISNGICIVRGFKILQGRNIGIALYGGICT